MGALSFNVGAPLRLPKVDSRRAERRLEEIELFRLLTAVQNHPRNRSIIDALYGSGARVEELVQLKRRQLIADNEGTAVMRRSAASTARAPFASVDGTWEALQQLADAKSPMSESSRSATSASARSSRAQLKPRGCRGSSRRIGYARAARTHTSTVRPAVSEGLLVALANPKSTSATGSWCKSGTVAPL